MIVLLIIVYVDLQQKKCINIGHNIYHIMEGQNNFIDKTTSLKTVERIKFKLSPFSKGSKIEITWAFNPEDSMHVDQFLELDPDKNNILIALRGFKKMAEQELGAKILTDE
jgi:hypothetical protein